MPHCIVEYSAHLAQQISISALVKTVHQGAIDSGLFEPTAIKTRAYGAEHSCVGATEGASFIHITLKIMPGRTDEQKQLLLQAIDKRIANMCSQVSSVTIEVLDLAKEHYFKRING